MIKKTVQRSDELYIQFTDEELKQLNISEGDKFSWKIQEDGSIFLEKFVKLDIELSELSREVLEYLVTESIEKDIPVNDVVCQVLEKITVEHTD
jgi:hypothetical protein